MSKPPVIHWFRRDLRLRDNIALHAALEQDAPVVPVFIFDPAILSSERFGLPRLKFMLKALTALDESLRRHQTRLLIRHGRPASELRKLIDELGATAVFFNRDYTPYARRRDADIEETLTVAIHSYDDGLLHAPGEVTKQDGNPYTVYTPFKKTWWQLPKPVASADELPSTRFHDLTDVDAPPIPGLRDLDFDDTIPVPEASETDARRRLAAFVDDPIFSYETARDRLLINPFEEEAAGTSGLSPYLRLGLLSPRQAYTAAAEVRNRMRREDKIDSVNTWIAELAWREFYAHILYHFPHVYHHNFRREYDVVEFRDAPDDLQKWKDGCTGFPVVDAAMRQLTGIGWMHNRARMIVSSFLTKDLLIHWWHGDVHFMNWLIDGDPASNNGGWQWAAGTGTDAQPYFRIFNPVSQSQKFDPDGTYIRHWIPELRHVPDKFIHTPWEMDEPPADYPPPMVDHKQARERTLAAYKAVRK